MTLADIIVTTVSGFVEAAVSQVEPAQRFIRCEPQKARLTIAACVGQYDRNAFGSPCRYCATGAERAGVQVRVKPEPKPPVGTPTRIGERFGMWEVISEPFRRGSRQLPHVTCLCHGCGKPFPVRSSQLRTKSTPSRGCKKCRVTQGLRRRVGIVADPRGELS